MEEYKTSFWERAMQLDYLHDMWDETVAASLDEAGLLRYRSNLLGSDARLTNFGGGNTSAKIADFDPITGQSVEILWVKGSGGDLGTIKRSGFATLYQAKLEQLKSRYRGIDHEDEMVALYPLCTFGQNSTAPSIDTPLHAFVPAKHVDHLHPDWAIALAASANGPALLERLRLEQQIHLVWLPWKRPGFELGLWLEQAIVDNPNCDGVILGSHGLFTWGDTSRASYVSTLRVLDAIGKFVVPRIEARGDLRFGGQLHSVRTDKADLVGIVGPILRGAFTNSQGKRSIMHHHHTDDVLHFVNSSHAAKLAERGTSCPDHFLRTKVKPLFVAWNPETGSADDLIAATVASLPSYRDDYKAYYEANKNSESPAIRGTDPSVVLIPGVGLLSFGKNAAEARITGEFYTNAIHVMDGATSLGDLAPVSEAIDPSMTCDNYVSLPAKEAFNIEYWALEEAKIQRMPAEKEMARRVVVVIGAGPGIGRAVARRVLTDGAVVVCADIQATLAEETAAILCNEFGRDAAIGVSVDITNRESVISMYNQAAQRYGGIDTIVIVAAVFFAPDEAGNLPDALFRKTYDVNVFGSFVAADEGGKALLRQGTGGDIVLVSSANALVSKKGSIAYDTSKTAVNHLVRELAVTYAPTIRVNAVAPATVVSGSQMFPKDRVIASLAKYNLPFDHDEDEEVLRERLAEFYALRTLLRGRVSPKEVTEAIYIMASQRLGLTTGHIIPVDAGLNEAFLR